jgi:hypothetical protein
MKLSRTSLQKDKLKECFSTAQWKNKESRAARRKKKAVPLALQ